MDSYYTPILTLTFHINGEAMIQKPKIKNILVATDLSQNAEHAFTYAVGMAEAHGAQITILNVIEKMDPNTELLLTALLEYGSTAELKRNTETDLIVRIKAYIEAFCASASDDAAQCTTMIRDIVVNHGDVVERILHFAGTGNYDLLIMGSRGLGIVKEALMGGTSRKVVLHSPIPVLIVPYKKEDHPQ